MLKPNDVLTKPYPVPNIPRQELGGKKFTIINTIRKDDLYDPEKTYYLTFIISHVDGKCYKVFFKGVAIMDFLERIISGEIFLPCYVELEEKRSEAGHDYLAFKTFFSKHPGAVDAEEPATF